VVLIAIGMTFENKINISFEKSYIFREKFFVTYLLLKLNHYLKLE
jgi:hypothetical protein